MEFYYRKEDGHTYWIGDGMVFGAPTHKDGTPDVDNAVIIDDFDLEEEDIQELDVEVRTHVTVEKTEDDFCTF